MKSFLKRNAALVVSAALEQADGRLHMSDNLFPNMTFGAVAPPKKDAKKAKKEVEEKVAEATKDDK